VAGQQELSMFARRKWKEMAGWQKAGTVLMSAVQLGLLAAALRDLRRRSADEVRGSKSLWTGALFVNWVGPISYFAFGRRS
jgi:hypothetical protein